MEKLLQKAIVLPLVVLLTFIVVIYKIQTKKPLASDTPLYETKAVKTIVARKLSFRYQATGYGYVKPSTSLTLKPEINGKISYIHPQLKQGASLPKDTVVLRIEPTTFEFSLNKNIASLNNTRSQLKQLQAEQRSLQKSLKIARENLKLEQGELKRLSTLWKKRLIARSVLDNEKQKVLVLKQEIEDLQGRLASYKNRQSATLAQINKSQTNLAESRDTLKRTEVILPLDARIGRVFVDKDEYIAIGSPMFEAFSMDAVEIKTQLPLDKFFPLLLTSNDQSFSFHSPADYQEKLSQLNIQAIVKLVGNNLNLAHWPGHIIRIGESVDPIRNTIDIIVLVNNPYQHIIPGKRPPLLKGMFVAIDFYSPVSDQLILPRTAIHQGRAYLANNNKLEIRAVDISHQQNQLVVIRQGIKVGEQVIISDVIPVFYDLPLTLIHDQETEQQLALQALGETSYELPLSEK